MNKGIIALIGCVGVLLVGAMIVGLIFLGQYNSLVKLNEEVSGNFAQVDVQLKRRFDLIPQMAKVVKAYAAHEQGLYDKITQARAAYGSAKTPEEKMKIENQLSSDLSRLLVIVESNPQFQAAGLYKGLLDEVAGTENRIAVAKKDYNDSIKIYNMKIKGIPGRFFASMLGYKEKSYFETAQGEKGVPDMKL